MQDNPVRLPAGDHERLDSLVVPRKMRLSTSRFPDPVISVYHIFPQHFKRKAEASYHIGRTMFETNSIPISWVEPLNAMDEVWVPSDFNVKTFARAGVDPAKIRKMVEGMAPCTACPVCARVCRVWLLFCAACGC